jgi:uncharacterized protein (TIGR00251 family)
VERPCYQEKPDGLVIDARVQPRASADRVEGVTGGRLRLRLTAPPVENAANGAAIALLAAWLGVPRSKVTLIGGDKSREKRFHVAGDPAALAAAVRAKLG